MSTQLTASRFTLTVDGHDLGSWQKVTGLDVTWDVVDYRSGAHDRTYASQLIQTTAMRGAGAPPGMTLPSGSRLRNIQLMRPRSSDPHMWAWHQQVQQGQMSSARKNGSITVYNAAGTPVAKYHLEAAWPSKLEIRGDPAGASGVLYEVVTLTCDHIQRVAH